MRNNQVMASFDLETRNRQQARLHGEIALELAMSDYIEGIPDPEDRAFVHLTDSIDLAEADATTLALMGYLMAWKNRREVSKPIFENIADHFARAIDLAQQLDDANAQAGAALFVKLHEGKALYVLGRYEGAMTVFSQGRELALIVKEYSQILGGVSIDLFAYHQGLTELARTGSLEKAYAYWNDISDQLLLSDRLVQTGSRHWEAGNKSRAAGDEAGAKLSFYQARKTLSEAKQRGNRSWKLYFTLGILHFDTHDYINAESNLKEATNLGPASVTFYWLARSLSDIAC